MSHPFTVLGLSAVILMLTASRLPAPIFEKKTPTPKPAAPKPKPAKKPIAERKPPATPAPRFAGTWSGIVDIPGPVQGGPQQCTYVINPAENSITVSGRGWGGTRTARVTGNILTYVAGAFNEITTRITLIDSRTARVVVTSNIWGSGRSSEVKRSQ